MTSPIWIAKEEPPEQEKRQKEKGMQMKERHRAVDEPFDPAGDSLFPAPVQQGAYPMMQQQQPGRNGIEKAALGDEHGERDRFPGHVSLIILKSVDLEKK